MIRRRLTRDEYVERAYELARRGHGKLSNEQVRQARSYHWTAKQAADSLGVHYRTIEKIRYREIYTHVA